MNRLFEEVTPTGKIKKIVYQLKASLGKVTTPENFVKDQRNPLLFKYEITNGSLLSNVDVVCEPIKVGKYTMQLTVTATTSDGKEIKPDPVTLEVFVGDAVINGYIRSGTVTREKQEFDINKGKDNLGRWPIGHIAWQIKVDDKCVEKLKELTKDHKNGPDPVQINDQKVGFGAASYVVFRQAENNIISDNRYMQVVEVKDGKVTKDELRRVFDYLSVQGRLSDDNQATTKFYKKSLIIENAAAGLIFISEHWGEMDMYGPACNCVDMANKGFHAVDITKVPDSHEKNPCYVELRVIYRDTLGKRQDNGIVHLSLPEKYKASMK
ncbi:MAG: hypothetical protein LBJ00_04965 [Planctomycetaceae bacterium]|nr:hypothetical protein [Planctomycetaceae bacterium]